MGDGAGKKGNELEHIKHLEHTVSAQQIVVAIIIIIVIIITGEFR